MKQRMPLTILILAATTLGLCIAWIDNSPNWDDTGISVLLILISSTSFGFIKAEYAALWALLIGAWIPLIGIMLHGNYPSLLALAFAFVGAFLGALAQRFLIPKTVSE